MFYMKVLIVTMKQQLKYSLIKSLAKSWFDIESAKRDGLFLHVSILDNRL